MKYYLSIMLSLVVLIQCYGQDSLTIKLSPIILPDAEMINNRYISIDASGKRVTIEYTDNGLRNGPQLQYVNKNHKGFCLGYLSYSKNHRIYNNEIDLTDDILNYILLKNTEVSNPYEEIAGYVNTTN